MKLNFNNIDPNHGYVEVHRCLYEPYIYIIDKIGALLFEKLLIYMYTSIINLSYLFNKTQHVCGTCPVGIFAQYYFFLKTLNIKLILSWKFILEKECSHFYLNIRYKIISILINRFFYDFFFGILQGVGFKSLYIIQSQKANKLKDYLIQYHIYSHPFYNNEKKTSFSPFF